nr:dynamin family protein [Vibrio splendidus]
MSGKHINDKLKEFLVNSRNKACLSQDDVAARSDVYGMGRTLDQRAVSRIEKQPMKADAIKLAGYLSAIGMEPSQYYEFLTDLTRNKEDILMENTNTKEIAAKVATALEKITTTRQAIKLAAQERSYIDSIDLCDKFDKYEDLLKSLNGKPIIGGFGHFDSGKTTMFNTLTGGKVLTERFQPATCVVNLLMHTNDQPSNIKCQVAIFRKGFKPHMIHSESLVNQYLIEQGGTEILDRLGVHNHDEAISSDAYIAIVFMDSPILEKVWLLDTPGDLNSDDEQDTEKALGGVELADGVIFLSMHAGFFKESDLGFATNIIRNRPPVEKANPLKHLLFVQSHCHSDLSPDDISMVGKVTFKRIKKQLDRLVFDHWVQDGHIDEAPSASDLTERTQPFWRENDLYRTSLVRQVDEMADYLIENHSAIVERNIKNIYSQADQVLAVAIESLRDKEQASSKRVEEVEQQDARFRKESSKITSLFKEIIGSCSDRKQKDLNDMEAFYRYNASAEGLEALITETYENKKEAQSEIGNYFSQLITSRLESNLKSSGKVISNEVEAALVRWQDAAPKMTKTLIDSNMDDLNIDVSSFNSRAAFIGGMAGLGSLGAMALYVSTIASNLGAYILVGKAAGVLVSLGIAGSVTSVTSFVAALGGPITIGIAIAAAIGYFVYRLMGSSWQKSLAKKVAEAIKKEKVWNQIETCIDKFWGNTQTAIQHGLDELVQQTDEYIDNLKADAATDYDISEIKLSVEALDMLRDLLAGNDGTKTA